MNRLILISVFALMSLGLQAQTHFDSLYHFGLPGSEFFNCIIEEDELFSLGNGFRMEPYYSLGLNFAHFDINGNLINHSYIEIDSTLIFLNLQRQFISKNNRFYGIGSFSGLIRDDDYLFSISNDINNFEEEWLITSTIDTSATLTSLFLFDDGPSDLIILSALRDTADRVSSCLSFYDLNNNVQRNEILLTSDPELKNMAAFVITDVNDSKYLLIGTISNNNLVDYHEAIFNNFIIETSKEGEVLKKIVFEDKQRQSVYDILKDVDGNIYYLTNAVGIKGERHPQIPDLIITEDSIKQLVVKLDSNYNMLWETSIGLDWQDVDDANFRKIIPANTPGEYVITGTHLVFDSIFSEQNIQAGLIAKINEDGDSLWLKSFLGFNKGGYLTQLSDIVASPDGGYIAVGVSAYNGTPDDPNPNWLQSYMVKVNEEGKIPDIGTNVVLEEYGGELNIYPNPTGDFIHIDQGKIQEVSYHLYDQNGMLLERHFGAFKDAIYTLDLSGHPGGIYYLNLKKDNKSLHTEKIIKQ